MWNALSSRIWIRVVGSISYDDNHYTTGNSRILKEFLIMLIFEQLLLIY